MTAGLGLSDPKTAAILAAGGTLVILAVAVFLPRRRPIAAAVVHTTLRGAGLLLVALLLGGPVVPFERHAPGTCLLALDVSASIDRAELRSAIASAASGPGGTIPFATAAALFASGVRGASDPLAAIGEEKDGPALASDPADALAALFAHPSAGPGSTLAILSDGRTDRVPAPLPGRVLDPLVFGVSTPSRDVVATDLLREEKSDERRAARAFVLEGRASREVAATLRVWVDGEEELERPTTVGPGAFAIPLSLELPPGRRLLAAGLEVPGDRSWNDLAVLSVEVESPLFVVVVSDAERSNLLAALEVQGIAAERISVAEFLADPKTAPRGPVLVLDRVAAEALSNEAVLADLRSRVRGGTGLLYLPPSTPGALFRSAGSPFLDLLPVRGLEPPPPEPDEPPEAPSEGTGKGEPDPDSGKRETKVAPSLGLVIMVDASSSMRGEKLGLAKESAIAASEVLHEEDHVAVIAFSEEARVVLELTRADDKPKIADRISRIGARGGTDFVAPLETAKEMFHLSNLRIRHAILLSDGEPSVMKPLRALVEEMAQAGITVSTVGCGTGFNEQTLSDIAGWGKGKFYPAYNAREIPQVFTIEAERIVRDSGARRRTPKSQATPPTPTPAPPEPAPEAPGPPPEPKEKPEPLSIRIPAPYVRGLPWEGVTGVRGRHPAQARPDAWVALETEKKAPLLAHASVGRGRVMVSAFDLQGGDGSGLADWTAFPAFLAQTVRFLAQGHLPARYDARWEASGRSADLVVTDALSREVDLTAFRIEVTDARGEAVAATTEVMGNGRMRFLFGEEASGAVLVRAAAPDGDVLTDGVLLGPVPELRVLGVDLPGLSRLASAVEGRVAAPVPGGLMPAGRTMRGERASGEDWLLLLFALIVADLLCQRIFPGRHRALSRTGSRS